VDILVGLEQELLDTLDGVDGLVLVDILEHHYQFRQDTQDNF
jgi:hypothetical protein